jgi:Flp pilus assembly pilin Flp
MSLRSRRVRADDSQVRHHPRRGGSQERAALADERGQAMVEFALVAPLFVLLVAGIIQFGVALNFWLDMQRIANQGARWAAVNCGPAGGFDPCTDGTTNTLQAYLGTERISGGLNPSIEVCYPQPTGQPGPFPTAGDPVTVELTKTMNLVPIIEVGSVDLRATATMRLELPPNTARIPDNGNGSGAC